MSVFNLDMSRSAAAALGLVLLSNLAAAETVPKQPRSVAGVVEVANVQPAKIVKPVYPPAARQAWLQGMSRPVIYGYIQNREVVRTLKARGFKKVVFTDGFESTWRYQLTSCRRVNT
jgi:hypothetical protein